VRSDVQVPVTISIPKSMDQFFERVSRKVIQVGEERIELKKKKTAVLVRALEYSLEHAEEWIGKA